MTIFDLFTNEKQRFLDNCTQCGICAEECPILPYTDCAEISSQEIQEGVFEYIENCVSNQLEVLSFPKYLSENLKKEFITMVFRLKRVRLAAAALILSIVCLPAPLMAFERYNEVKKYDMYFSKYSKRYFGPGFDWRHFKAQAVAESRLKAKAKSHTGAMGIMQIMPRTFKEIARKNPSIKGTRAQPKWNISAGIYYDRQLWKTWKAKRPFQDRVNFMFGSYNAGKMNIIKAQKLAGKQGLNPNLWQSIESELPEVTGKNSRETLGYVEKIEKIREVLH